MQANQGKVIETINSLIQQLDAAIKDAREKIDRDHPRSSQNHLNHLIEQKNIFLRLKQRLTIKE
jgi:hypothetical protein